jgi:hypothetical protein
VALALLARGRRGRHSPAKGQMSCSLVKARAVGVPTLLARARQRGASTCACCFEVRQYIHALISERLARGHSHARVDLKEVTRKHGVRMRPQGKRMRHQQYINPSAQSYV